MQHEGRKCKWKLVFRLANNLYDVLPDPFKERAIQARCRALASLPEKDQERIFYTIDGLIRDAKARVAYA